MYRNIDISILTVNYNGLDDTCSLINSIPCSNPYRTEVIVVDNASRNNEAAILAQRYPWIKVIRSQQNLGFAGGNNLGIKSEANIFSSLTMTPPSAASISRHLSGGWKARKR